MSKQPAKTVRLFVNEYHQRESFFTWMDKLRQHRTAFAGPPLSSKLVLFLVAAAMGPATLYSQFEVADQKIEVHGFVSQGFVVSDGNNYLTMKTTAGSFALTDGALNASFQITSKFRVGAQLYIMNIGQLGAWRPQLDWALGDYKFKDWFGIRAGKVKTTLGLYTDTQDEAFLTTWAILPQSIYPIDLRASTIAHIGADVYRHVSLGRLGTLSYVAYTGERPDDRYGGYIYGLQGLGVHLTRCDGRMEGGDLRWDAPVKNLLVGLSYMTQSMKGVGMGPGGEPNFQKSRVDEMAQYYVEYALGNLRLDAEYRRYLRDQLIFDDFPGIPKEVNADGRSFYVQQLMRSLNVGSWGLITPVFTRTRGPI